MLLIHVAQTTRHPAAEYEWYVTDNHLPFPSHVGILDITHIVASGNELDLISNLAFAISQYSKPAVMVTWFGDQAKFIVANVVLGKVLMEQSVRCYHAAIVGTDVAPETIPADVI